MKFFPMFLQMAGRDVVIVGGGEQAAQKARLMLKTEARITVLAPELGPELAALVAAGRIGHDTAPITPARFRGAALVFIGSGCADHDGAIAAMAHAAGVVVNVVDQPHLCNAITPSIVDRDPLVVAIGTEGAAPVLARQIKTRLEEMLEPRLGDFVALAGGLRAAVAARVPHAARRGFWVWAFAGAPRRLFTRGAGDAARDMLHDAIAAGGAPDGAPAGALTLVGKGPCAPDLLTLRAVQRLQEADMVFFGHAGADDLLELARRDAERVRLAPGAPALQAEVAAARAGANVVRLVAGADPGADPALAPAVAAARAAGLWVEIVPGVGGPQG